MKKVFTFLLSTLFFLNSSAQFNYSGVVLDASTNEPIEGVQLTWSYQGHSIGQTTSEDGKFHIGLGTESYMMRVSHVAYQQIVTPITLDKDSTSIIYMVDKIEQQEEVIVSGLRVEKGSPYSFTTLKRAEINKVNYGQDLPYVLNQTPSVLVHSDAGAGVGYTGMRIRGVDPTRINITINGIPLNDAESHGVFWVNLPDLSSSISSIQIQRGVGSSTNGSAAFGASVNLKTDAIAQKAFGRVTGGIGSFGTQRVAVEFGTGLTQSSWGLQGRISKIQSDGFVDRASSDLESVFLTAGHYGKKSVLKFVMMKGFERTYQAWYGVPQPKFNQDGDGLASFVYDLGISGEYLENLNNSAYNTYNYYTYENEVDNYNQDHYQLFYTHRLKKNWTWKAAAHYTRGYGYFEQYQDKNNWLDDTRFSDYGLDNVVLGGDTITNGSFIRRRWLDNHLYGALGSVRLKTYNHTFDLGIAYQEYRGGHYGELVWAEYASNSQLGSRYYDNSAIKKEGNSFAKYARSLNKRINVFGDIQFRWVTYDFQGPNQRGALTDQSDDFLFFNPKAGISYKLSSKQSFYGSVARSNREPVRSDYSESSVNSRPRHETLTDLELGARWENRNAFWALNLYFMEYDNQLVLTGKINDVGAATRENVKKSFRRGVELEGATILNKKLEVAGNINYSMNKVLDYVEYIDNWLTGEQESFSYEQSNLAFSPDYIFSGVVTYSPIQSLNINAMIKSVGSQYLDNSESEARQLDAYNLADISAEYSFRAFDLECELSVLVNNLFDTDYAPNGYTFGGKLPKGRQSYNYVYPQAGRNFFTKLVVKI